MSTKPDLDRLHPLLCAYVLDEASEAERAEVEAALAASPAVREELERLEGTIGLVRSALGGEERLSEGAMDSLMRVAGQSPPPVIRPIAWYRSPGLRAAAAVVALLGGVAAILSIDGAPAHRDTSVASEVPAAERAQRGDELVTRLANELSQLGLREKSRAGGELAKSSDADEAGGLPEEQLGAFRAELERANKAGDAGLVEAYKELAGRSLDERARQQLRYSRTLTEEAEPDLSGGIALGRGEAEFVTRAGAESGSEVVALDELGYSGPGITALPGAGGSLDGLRVDRLRIVDAPTGTAGVKAERETKVATGDAAGQWSGQSTYEFTSPQKGSDDLLARGGAGGGGADEKAAASVETRRRAGLPPPASEPMAPGPAGPASPGPVTATSGVPSGVTAGEVLYLGAAVQPAEPSVGLVVVDPDLLTEARGGFDPTTLPPTGEARSYVLDFDVEGWAPFGGQLDEEAFEAFEQRLQRDGQDFFDDTVRYGESEKDVARSYGKRPSRKLTPDELDLVLRRECERLFQGCRRLPHERPRDMFFRFWGDNAFSVTRDDALSTFGVDVDTASYVLARRYLNEGHLPEKAQVRTEEFVNYFKPDLDPPTEATFAIHTELAPSLFGGSERRWMLRVGVRGKEIAAEERQPLVLTFVLDTSGSMKENDRLELVKHAVRLLLGELDARDSIALVTFSNETRLVLPMTSAASRGVIEAALHPLSPNGSTNAEAGLKLGYEVALAALDGHAHNRVVFLSDGVANVGQTDQNRLSEDVRRHREKGLYLNTIGVGMNNHNDVFLEQLADKGDGICDYVDSPEAAKRAIVDRFAGAFQPIASDVKIQVEFDPAQVERYRLLGYENRAIADKDFRNDAIDAGEVGAGHQVVALYEIERSAAVPDGPLATVRLRWKAPKIANQDPNEVDVTEVEHAVDAASALGAFETGSAGYRRSVLAAQFAEFLRRSVHARGDSYEALMLETAKLANETSDAEVAELAELEKRAYVLNVHEHRHRSELEATVEEYRRFQYLKCQLEELQKELGQDQLDQIRRTNDELEDQIRDLIRKDLERRNG